MRLVVEVPAQSFELSLAEVHSLRANLPREDKRSLVPLLRACYARLHGVDPATCSQTFPKTHQMLTAAHQMLTAQLQCNMVPYLLGAHESSRAACFCASFDAART